MRIPVHAIRSTFSSIQTLVEAVMLKGSTDKEESKEIYSRLGAMAARRTKLNADGSECREIKLCYVTVSLIYLLVAALS